MAPSDLAAEGGLGSSPADPPRMEAKRATALVVLDGRLDEPDWQSAAPVRGFLQIDPRSGEAATRDTEVRALFDGRALYLGVRCHDDEGLEGVRVPDLRRDFDYDQNDLFGVSFDPFRDGRTAQAFQVNPWGAQRDLRVTDDTLFDLDWDAAWSARAQVGEDGWTVEIALPWSSLRYPEGAREWGIQFTRQVRRIAELSGWPAWPRGLNGYRMSYAGVISGLEPPPPARNLRLQPYLLGRIDRAGGRDGREDDEGLEAGGEVKWLPSPATVVDLTVNTDFAQVDADRQVVNLSRFSVFFPEKRPFFLENAALFDSNFSSLKPFFSRRIGLDAGGRPLPIDGGLRVVDQDAERSWGGLVARTAGAGAAPASTFAVARFSENVGSRHRLGGMLVGRSDEGNGGGDGRSNGVAVIDGLFRPRDLVTVQGFLSASRSTGAGGEGIAGSLWAAWEGPRGYFGWIQQFVSPDYEAAAGFVRRTDYVYTSPAVTLDWRPAWLPKRIRKLKPNAVLNLYHSFEGLRLQEGYARLEPLWVVFQDGSEVWSWWEPNWQRLDEPFSPLPGLTAAPGDYDYGRWGIAGATDRSRRFGLEVRHTSGGFYDGRLDSTTTTLRAAPSPRVALRLDWQRDAIRDLGPDRGRRTTDLLSPEVRLAWDPRKQLTLFYQHNEAAETANWYARFAWELRPLSHLYVVYADTAPTDPRAGFLVRPDVRDRQLILKLSWLWQR